jgi:hypothetical protein
MPEKGGSPVEKADWKKSPPELVEVFEAVFPGPPAVARQMFGYPTGFVNGNMFMGLHQHNMVLRLPEGPRAELLRWRVPPRSNRWRGAR